MNLVKVKVKFKILFLTRIIPGQEIKRSPFNVKIGPHKNSKIKAYGPGLKGGIVNKPARFTVDTCGETGALGFQIEGPSQVRVPLPQ